MTQLQTLPALNAPSETPAPFDGPQPWQLHASNAEANLQTALPDDPAANDEAAGRNRRSLLQAPQACFSFPAPRMLLKVYKV